MYLNPNITQSLALQQHESDYLPSFPAINVTFPNTALTLAAVAYLRENTSPSTYTHCVRSAYFALILLTKVAGFGDLAGTPSAVELVLVAILLHDLGWATNKALISPDKRFEVDGANSARRFLRCLSSSVTVTTSADDNEDCSDVRAVVVGATDVGGGGGGGGGLHDYDDHALQLVWDSIALHTSESIAQHKEPEVALTNSGVFADFFGPHYDYPATPGPDSLITAEEFETIVAAFPRLGFSDNLVALFGEFCRDKPEATYDNLVGEFGKRFGYDGKGGGREEYVRLWEEHNIVDTMLGALNATVPYE